MYKIEQASEYMVAVHGYEREKGRSYTYSFNESLRSTAIVFGSPWYVNIALWIWHRCDARRERKAFKEPAHDPG